jgi:hypothetical protein
VVAQIAKALIDRARTFIGVTEQGGDNRGKDVEMFQRAVDGKASREAWCMCFVQHCVKETKAQLEKTGLYKKVFITLYPSEHCMTVWNKTNPKYRRTEPKKGYVVIWQYYKNGKATAQGHTGIVDSVSNDGKSSMLTIEGNTGPGGAIVREGDGVYAKTRSISGSSSMKIVGFLVPLEVEE